MSDLMVHNRKASVENLCGDLSRIEKYWACNTLNRSAYFRIPNFIPTEIAEGAYAELLNDSRYVRTDHMPNPTGIGLGILKTHDQCLSTNVQKCCDLLTGNEFRSCLGACSGQTLQVVKPPTLFRMELGDRIVRHDDVLASPLNRISVVLHLSKNWKRQFGGNTVLGYVQRSEEVHSANSAYPQHRWVFSAKRSVLVPAFNSLMVIALRKGMAHAVTPVRAHAYRVSIVCLYGREAKDTVTHNHYDA